MIFLDDELIKVNGVMLPGLVKSIEISSDAKIEEQEIEGSNAKPKQVTGYEDAKVMIDLILDDGEKQTKEEKLGIIQSLFKKKGQSLPVVYDIVSQHTSVRNTGRVIFKKLSSKETNNKSELSVSLEFWEYVPVKITASKKGTSSTSINLSPEYAAYLNSSRGKAPYANTAPVINDKTVMSPTQLVASVGASPIKMALLTSAPFDKGGGSLGVVSSGGTGIARGMESA